MDPVQDAGEEKGKEPPYPLIRRLTREKVLPSLRMDGGEER